MNPQTVRKPHDRAKIYNEYIASLQAQTALLKRTENAVSVLQQTGQTPVQPTDTRTMTQKTLDLDGQKTAVRRLLLSIMDGEQVALVMDELSQGEITFLSWAYQDIFTQLKAKYAAGVPAPIFVEFLRRYMADYSKNLGVKEGLQNQRSNELMLSMRQIIDLLPSAQTMNELIYTIRSIPGDIISAQLKQAALDATTGFGAAIPSTTLADTALKLDPTALNQATQLLNNGFENAPSNQQAQKMSNAVNRAISSNSPGQVTDVLTNF